MSKCNRSRTRTEEALSLATTAAQQGWTQDRVDRELESSIARNLDLVELNAINTFKSEFYKFAHPRLNGFLPAIRRLADRAIDAQEPNGKRRFNHELSKFCNRALKHHAGLGVAIREIEAEL